MITCLGAKYINIPLIYFVFMVARFSKTFPKSVSGTSYPVWEEVVLTAMEEKEAEEACRQDNLRLFDECLFDAKGLAIKHGINQDHIQNKIAIALFEKRASHVVFWKEGKAREKFDGKSLGEK